MKQKSMVILSVITLLTIIFTLCGVNVQAVKTLTANATGTIDGYSYNNQPNGNSYMAVYGWTEEPLVEYYIINSYGTWKPHGNGIATKGTINVDGLSK